MEKGKLLDASCYGCFFDFKAMSSERETAVADED